jgi:hypothetical protein
LEGRIKSLNTELESSIHQNAILKQEAINSKNKANAILSEMERGMIQGMTALKGL